MIMRKSKYSKDLEKMIIDLCSETLAVLGESNDDDESKNNLRKKCRSLTWTVKSNYSSIKEKPDD